MLRFPDSSNLKPLCEVGFGNTIIDSQGRKGVRGNLDFAARKCRVVLNETNEVLEVDWYERVKVVPADDIKPLI